MNNAYIQVALTYFRRLFSSFWLGLVILVALGMIFLPVVGTPSHNRQAWQNWWLFKFNFFFEGCTILFALMLIHIKEQFTDSRAHLLPDFRKAHIVVAGAVAFVVAILLPVAASLCLRLHSIGFVAFMVFWFGLICWAFLVQKTLQMGVIFVGFMGVIFVGFFPWFIWGGNFMEQLCSGKYELPALGLLAIGLAIIVYCGVRLCRLNEDMPEYYSGLKMTRWSGKGQAGAGAQWKPGGFGDRYWSRHMARLIRHAQCSPDSLWSQICRWQIGMQTGWAILWLAGVFLGVCSTPYFVVPLIPHPNNPQPQFSIAMMVMMVTIIPTASVWGVLWRRRTQSLQYEFLLPVDRATYLKQVGVAAALNQFQLWVATSAAVVLSLQIMAPQFTSLLIDTLIYSFLCQIGIFGLGVWFLRFGKPIRIFLVGVMWMQVMMFTIVMFTAMPGPGAALRPVILLSATGFAAFGLLAAWDGYRRWLVADVG